MISSLDNMICQQKINNLFREYELVDQNYVFGEKKRFWEPGPGELGGPESWIPGAGELETGTPDAVCAPGLAGPLAQYINRYINRFIVIFVSVIIAVKFQQCVLYSAPSRGECTSNDIFSWAHFVFVNFYNGWCAQSR